MEAVNASVTTTMKHHSKIYFDDFEFETEWVDAYKVYYLVIDSVFMLPTIFGNTLILLAIWRFPRLRKNTSCILIGNLAISDLLVGAVVFPMDLSTLAGSSFNQTVTFCLWYQCSIYTLLVTSVLNLFILSLERFHAIRKPLVHAVVFTKRRVYIMCVAIWVFVTVFGFTPLLGWHREVDIESFVCRGSGLADETYKRIMVYLAVGSLLINAVFFVIVVRVVVKAASEMRLRGENSRHRSNQRVRRDVRHTLMMLMVSGLFMVLWGPYCAIAVVPNRSNTLKFIGNWMASLGMINSSTNWIIYGLRSKRFRHAFQTILKCRAYQPSRLSSISTSMSS